MTTLMRKIILISELLIRSVLPPFYSFSLIEDICKKKLNRCPENRDVLWILSNFYVFYGKHKEAESFLETLAKSDADTKPVRLLLSRVYFRLGKYKDVAEVLCFGEILSDTDSENYYLGDSLIELGRYKDASIYLNRYVKKYRNDYIPFVRLGFSFYMQGLYNYALAAYRQAERLNPYRKEIRDSINLCVLNSADHGSITDTAAGSV